MIEKMNEKIAAAKEPTFTGSATGQEAEALPKKKRRVGLFEKM